MKIESAANAGFAVLAHKSELIFPNAIDLSGERCRQPPIIRQHLRQIDEPVMPRDAEPQVAIFTDAQRLVEKSGALDTGSAKKHGGWRDARAAAINMPRNPARKIFFRKFSRLKKLAGGADHRNVGVNQAGVAVRLQNSGAALQTRLKKNIVGIEQRDQIAIRRLNARIPRGRRAAIRLEQITDLR